MTTTSPFSQWRRSDPGGKVFGCFGKSNGAHDAARHADSFERRLKIQGIGEGGKHADVVGKTSVHSFGAAAAKNIASADDDADLHARIDDLADLQSNFVDNRLIEAKPFTACEYLARQFQEYSLVHRLEHVTSQSR